jgi:hypothetical protein
LAGEIFGEHTCLHQESNTLKHFISSDIALEQTFIKQGWTLESCSQHFGFAKITGIAQHHHADD